MSLDAVMIAHPSIQDLSSEAELVSHDTNPLAIAGYRRQMTFRTPGARRQDWVLGTMGFALHRDANFSRFKLILVEIATTRLIQRRVISYRLLSSFSTTLYIYYIIFFLKNQIFFLKGGFWSG